MGTVHMVAVAGSRVSPENQISLRVLEACCCSCHN